MRRLFRSGLRTPAQGRSAGGWPAGRARGATHSWTGSRRSRWRTRHGRHSGSFFQWRWWVWLQRELVRRPAAEALRLEALDHALEAAEFDGLFGDAFEEFGGGAIGLVLDNVEPGIAAFGLSGVD